MTALTVGRVMTRCPVSVPAGTPFATVAAVLARRRIGAVPVVDRDGRLADAGVRRLFVTEHGRLVGVLSRRDLLTTYLRDDDAIRADVEHVVDEHVNVSVRDGVVLLLGLVEWRGTRAEIAERVRAVPGVVEVRDRLGYVFDDGARPGLTGVPR